MRGPVLITICITYGSLSSTLERDFKRTYLTNLPGSFASDNARIQRGFWKQDIEFFSSPESLIHAYPYTQVNERHSYWISSIPGVYKIIPGPNIITSYNRLQTDDNNKKVNVFIDEIIRTYFGKTTLKYQNGSNTESIPPDNGSNTESIPPDNGSNTESIPPDNGSNTESIPPENTRAITAKTNTIPAIANNSLYPDSLTAQFHKTEKNEEDTSLLGQVAPSVHVDNENTNRSAVEKQSEKAANKSNSEELKVTNDTFVNESLQRSSQVTDASAITDDSNNNTLYEEFKIASAEMEKHFYLKTFGMLSANSPAERRDTGISFVVSGAWLHVLLLLLSGETDADARAQLDNVTRFPHTLQEKDQVIKTFVAQLPPSSDSLKLRWSNRLVLGPGVQVSEEFRSRSRDTLDLQIDTVAEDNVTKLVYTLNDMVRRDTGGALPGTFDEQDVAGGVHALLLSTLYLRSSWRAPVTLLNGTRDFRDTRMPPYRQTRMFRVNDLIGYALVPEWDAEVVEIPYATANLSLVAVVPRAAEGLSAAVRGAAAEGARALTRRMHVRRVAITLPLFTLRMTLLLPTKLEAMGAEALVRAPAAQEGQGRGLRLSHAVQRLMFWADAGRNAFKDDGVEWDPQPELSLVVDRPYFFMVKWNDFVLMSGNFVL